MLATALLAPRLLLAQGITFGGKTTFGGPFSAGGAAASGASLSGSYTTSTSAVNITTTGSTDWIHWGGTSSSNTCNGVNRKSGGGSQISDYTVNGSGGNNAYPNDARAISWTDGTPTASDTNQTGCYTLGQSGSSFTFTLPASTAAHTAILYLGGFNMTAGQLKLTAHLADGSAADYTDTTCGVGGGTFDCNYTLTYKAGSSTTLNVTWGATAATAGNMTVEGVAYQ